MTCFSRRRLVAPSIVLLALLAGGVGLQAQQLTFTPDDATGIYALGKRVGWTVAASEGVEAAGSYHFTIRRDGGEELAAGVLDLSGGPGRIETELGEPGMVQVEVRPVVPDTTFGDQSTGGPGRILLGAAVEPTGIRPAEAEPPDFDTFWRGQLERLERVPLGAVVTPGESDRPGLEYATVRMNNINGAHVYAQLAEPRGEGPFPALVIYQWAGGPYPLEQSWATERAAEGWLVLNVQPHDVPTDMPQAFYDALPALIRNYPRIGRHSREESYFLRMYLGDYRAVEYLAGRPDWDGETMVVMGTSMGGQQSLATAGLNPRVTALIVHVPAGADVAGPLHGRAPSYPNWDVTRSEVLETARYFDAATFASRITVPSLVSMGFIDGVTTPASIWSAFNVIKGPKEAVPLVDAHHNHLATEAQQLPYTERAAEWLDSLVRGSDPPHPRTSSPLSKETRRWPSTRPRREL